MSEKYKIYDQDKAYFLTMTVVGWIDVFTRVNHKMAIINSLKHCQKEKGLVIYAYCLMPGHLHLIAQATEKVTLSDILRDFKKYTSKSIVKQIIDEPESRREWMLKQFYKAGEHLKGIKNYKFWQDGNHPIELSNNELIWQRLNYIHQNPVEEMIVKQPEDYMFSSARNYAGLDSLLDVELIDQKMITYR
jgi:REP element-mobilizing transposase RayT